MSDDVEPQTDYRIALGVLEDIVRGALTQESDVRLHHGLRLGRDKDIDVSVSEGRCRVSLGLDARLGNHLPTTGARVQALVAEHLESITGLSVESMDVTFVSVMPADEPA